MTDEDVRTSLTAHAAAVIGKPVAWGVDDCARFTAAWVERLTGEALALPRWTNEAEAQALQADPGPLVLWSAALDAFPALPEAGLGDVGLVETRGFGLVGAIGLGNGLALWRTRDSVAAFLARRWAMAWAVRP